MIYPREGLHLGILVSWLVQGTTSLPAILLSYCLIATRTCHGLPYPQLVNLLPSRNKLIVLAAIITGRRLFDHVNTQSINGWQASKKVNFNDEVIVVTGGSSGIGASVVHQIALEATSAKVVILDVVEPTWEVPRNVRFFKCDLSRTDDLLRTAKQLQKVVGDPTILGKKSRYITSIRKAFLNIFIAVNNAGLSRGRLMSNLESSDVSITLVVNLVAPMLLIRQLLPAMIARKHGHILNVASLSAFVPPAGLADYAASKGGLLAMSESPRLELRHMNQARQVRVSSMILAFVQTPLFKGKTNQSEFFMPLLHVDTVGEEMFEILRSGSSAIRTMPAFAGIFGSLSMYPRSVQDAILNGTNELEVDYKGRQVVDGAGHIQSA